MTLSTCRLYGATHLYDAVYLYLRTVNQTLAEGYDYRDGRLIRNKTIGQRFVGMFHRLS